MMQHQSDIYRMTDFLDRIDRTAPDDLSDAFCNEVIENGGTYVPQQDGNEASHLFEISLHGVVSFGASEAEAIRNWVKAARQHVAAVEDAKVITWTPWTWTSFAQGTMQ